MKKLSILAALVILLWICLPWTICSGEEGLPSMIKRVEPSIVVLLTYNREGKFVGQGSGFFFQSGRGCHYKLSCVERRSPC